MKHWRLVEVPNPSTALLPLMRHRGMRRLCTLHHQTGNDQGFSYRRLLPLVLLQYSPVSRRQVCTVHELRGPQNTAAFCFADRAAAPSRNVTALLRSFLPGTPERLHPTLAEPGFQLRSMWVLGSVLAAGPSGPSS